jgi:hypothetical protein
MTPEDIQTTIREIRSLEATIKKATRMREARKQKLIEHWNELKGRHGLTLNDASRIAGITRHSLVGAFYAGNLPFFTSNRCEVFFQKIFSHIRKKSLAVRDDEE